MPFEKGHRKHPASGMKPGQKSLKTQAWERLGDYVINEGAARYLKHLRSLPDKEFVHEFKSVMEFFKPKLQRAIPNIEKEGLTPEDQVSTYAQLIASQCLKVEEDLAWRVRQDEEILQKSRSKPPSVS